MMNNIDNKTINHIRTKYQYLELEKINKCNYAILKGEVLSKQAYGTEGLRQSSDIDLLIPRSNVGFVEKSLIEFGYTNANKSRSNKIALLSTSHQVSPWVKAIPPFGNLVIDINFDIFWGEYEGTRIDIEEFLSNTIEMNIYGTKVKSLPPIKTLIQLILHHYKDMNSIFLLATRNSIRYEMFKDIYYLLINNMDTITIDNLYRMSLKYGIIPYVYYVLYYTGQLYKDKNLEKFIEAFKTTEGEALLDSYGLNTKERKEWKYDFKTRLNSDNLLALIEKDLSINDIKKIEINKRIFLGV